jgi:hypothetical protein
MLHYQIQQETDNLFGKQKKFDIKKIMHLIRSISLH